MQSIFKRFRMDPFLLALLAVVALATVAPARGDFAGQFGVATKLAIALLFFLHGARLSRQTVVAGLTHWRLHLMILAATFGLFPLLGIAFSVLEPRFLSPAIYLGLLYLCVLPSTVQSSIAFTSIAGGNVPAAVCAASLSNLAGMALTPLLAAAMMGARGHGFSWQAVGNILVQLLLPFVLGQLLQTRMADWVGRNRQLVMLVDRGSIVMSVYLAFSAAVVEGLWTRLTPAAFGLMVAAEAVLLALVLAATTFGSRALGFNRADEIAIVFCGSKKSLASGVPMANAMFAPTMVGAMVLPLLFFHQMQLMVCAVLARRYAARSGAADL